MDVIASHHVAQTHLDEVGNGALRLGDAKVHGHGLDAGELAGLVLQHHVAHLRAVAVADNDVIVALEQGAETLTGVLHILNLLAIGAFLAASQESISPESNNS